jgi:hypothetical protein
MYLRIGLALLVILSLIESSFGQTFAPYYAITTGSSARVVAIGDLNNDGLNDVALGTGNASDPTNDYKVFVFYQDYSGYLSLPVKYSYPHITGNGLRAISIGDVNNDQLNDVVIGNDNSVGIYYQNNLGLLNPIVSYTTGYGVDGVKVGDLNNDGLSDIAVSHWNSSYIKVLYQTSTIFNIFSYSNPQSGYDEIDIADVTNDGLNDLVFMAGQGYYALRVFKQNLFGTLDSAISFHHQLFTSASGIGIGDINNDGANDIVVSKSHNQPNSKIYLFKQDTVLGTWGTYDSLPAYDIPEPIEVADCDCNGKNEIITANAGWHHISVYKQNGLSQFTSYNLYYVPYVSHYQPQGLAVGDINNDGRKDILLAAFEQGLIILKNITPPTQFNNNGIKTVTDTIYKTIAHYTSSYSIKSSFGADTTCHVFKTDSFEVKKIFDIDSIKKTNYHVYTAMMCTLLTDTLLTTYIYKRDSVLYSIDTVFLSTSYDTLFSPLVPRDTIVQKDVINTNTIVHSQYFSTENTLQSNSDCALTETKNYVINTHFLVDSIKIDSSIVRTAINCSTFYSDTIIKINRYCDSTLIASDTLLLSTKIDTSYLSQRENLNLNNLILVFPVPTDNYISISITNPCYSYYPNTAIQIELFDTRSRIIYRTTKNANEFPFSLEMKDYSNGIYCLRISNKKDACIKKLVKEK